MGEQVSTRPPSKSSAAAYGRLLHFVRKTVFVPSATFVFPKESRSPEPHAFVILRREKANKVFGKHLARLLKDLCHNSFSVQAGAAAYCHLLHSVRKTVFIPSATFVFPKAKTQ